MDTSNPAKTRTANTKVEADFIDEYLLISSSAVCRWGLKSKSCLNLQRDCDCSPRIHSHITGFAAVVSEIVLSPPRVSLMPSDPRSSFGPRWCCRWFFAYALCRVPCRSG